MTTNNKTSHKLKRAKAFHDPVVAEVRAARNKIAARFDYDIGRIIDHFTSLDKKGLKKTSPRRRTSKTKSKSK